MKKLLLSLILSVFLFGKILVVNSYSIKDQCGIPQLQGFLSTMYQNGYTPSDFKVVFLNVRTTLKKRFIKKCKKYFKKYKKI
jgi:hypothetical protein